MPSQEVHFFDNDNEYAKGIDHYISKMLPSYSDQITMEKVLIVSYFELENLTSLTN